MAKLVWRVKLVAELEPGFASETEVARRDRNDARRAIDDLHQLARCGDEVGTVLALSQEPGLAGGFETSETAA